MTKHRVKLALAATLLLASIAALAIGLGRLGRLVEHFGSGADPAAALTVPASPEQVAGIEWLRDLPQPARDLEPASRRAVQDGYLRAWNEIAAGTGGRGAYLTGPARLALTDETPGATVRDLAHTLRLEFYSADGQVLVMTDTASVVRAAPVGGDRLLVAAGPEKFRAILLLEDGNWRVRSLTRLDSAGPELRLLADPRPDSALAIAGGALLLALSTFLPGRRRFGRAVRRPIHKLERN